MNDLPSTTAAESARVAAPAVPRHDEGPAMPKWRHVAVRVVRGIPFVGLHVAALAVFFVPATPTALTLGAVTYLIRMFGITGGYHRYFSHHSYATSRWFQFMLAWMGCSAWQKGPLFWSYYHRRHHRHSDTADDPHSPRAGVWHAHLGWIFDPMNLRYQAEQVRDLALFPELRWLDRNHWVPGIALAAACYAVGGSSGLVWGGVVSAVACYHVIFGINSVCHLYGRRRYTTPDDSRNNFIFALLALGDGWHNNHHYRPGSARHGHRWWEIDVVYSVLRLFAFCGLVWGLRADVGGRGPDAGTSSRTAARPSGCGADGVWSSLIL